jgi:hypothetical protein
MDFCQWLLQQRAVGPGFPLLVLFTGKAGFTRDRIIKDSLGTKSSRIHLGWNYQFPQFVCMG